MKNYLEKIPKMIQSIPAISGNTLALIDLIGKGDYKTNDLAKMIETDITLSSRCLQMVNSPVFALKSQVGSIKRAVVLLGATTVANIALQTVLSKALSKNLTGYQCSSDELWKHSLMAAIAARRVAGEMKLECKDTAYAAGLLHDIGKLIISEFLVEEADHIQEALSDMHDFLGSEESLLGTDHAQVGSLIAESWRLPEVFRMVILHHHRPSDAPEAFQNLILCVHLGDIFAMMAGTGTGLDTMSYPLDPLAEKFMKNDVAWELQKFPKLLLDIDVEYQEAVALTNGIGGRDV